MVSGPTITRPRLAWLVLAVAVVVVVVVSVLVVRAVRSPGGTVAASSSPTPAASATGSPTSGGQTSASPTSSTSRPASSAGDTSASTAPEPTTGPRTRSPVPLDTTETVDRGLTARVTTLEAVTGKAQGPGEVAGPAVRTSVTLTNRSGRTVDLSNTVVNLLYGPDQQPASVLSGPGVQALPASVKDGKQASGRYVFAVPTDQRAEVLITVDYSVRTDIVAFRGKAPS